MNNDLTQAMNKQLANWQVLYTKLHNYHWFVKGPDFFSLHEKFEEMYSGAAANIDEIAERILTIGGEPAASIKEYLELASIEEARGGESAKEMVSALSEDLGELSRGFEEIIELAEKQEDEPTADMFIGMKTAIEKDKWMMDAYLG
ncbi:DNA starvation/stationary phase protection protein [Evansella sp. LMS18]|uniref:Dps family protein n=1 Tax=Evansella sp. LMS18 TaxID=2924033 RepID=UPI0020D00C1C|nr:Dps family protein [Evansella sp. LMS18]UTR08672.1 DNA starvation/stationary phase protection protein [Evansella sp. LMS18]